MRIAIVALALVVGIAAASGGGRAARAQDAGWTEIYNRPPTTIRHINMFDEHFGLAIAAPGILRTTDGGRTWTEPAAKPFIASGATGIADANHAWAVGFSGSIWRTDDGGVTWRTQASGTNAHLGDIAVVSASEAWVTGRGAGFSDVGPFAHPVSVLLHTTDGGATWQSVSMTAYGQFVSIEEREGRLWVAASQCREGDPVNDGGPNGRPACRDHISLLRSDDNGASWDVLGTEPGIAPTHVQFLTRTAGFASYDDCTVSVSVCLLAYLATSDGGTTWHQRGPSPLRYAADPQFFDANNGFAVTQDCGGATCSTQLYRSVDGARTWTLEATSAPSGYEESGGAFDFASRDLLVTAGGPTGIVRYDAVAKTWEAAPTDARASLSGVVFVDDVTGYALASGDLAATHDGGATWGRLATPERFVGLDTGVDGSLWAAPSCQVDPCPQWVYRSLDGGASWQRKALPGVSGGDVQAADARRAWVSLVGGLWRTDDGGDTWAIVDPSPFGSRATFFDRDHGWTPECGGIQCDHAIRVTSDGGGTWDTRPLPENAEGPSFSTADVGTARLYIPGSQNNIGDHLLVTIDGGRTWPDRGPQPFFVGNPRFIDASHAWAVAQDFYVYDDNVVPPPSRIVSTTDGARTWTDEFTLPPSVYGNIITSGDRAWLVAAAGDNPFGYGRTVIYRRDIAGGGRRIAPPNTGSGGSAGDEGTGFALACLYAISPSALMLRAWFGRTRRGSTG